MPTNYDLVINTATLSIDDAVKVISAALGWWNAFLWDSRFFKTHLKNIEIPRDRSACIPYLAMPAAAFGAPIDLSSVITSFNFMPPM